MAALDQGRLGPRFPRRPLHPHSLAPQHGGACHPSRPSSSVSVKIFCCLATFPLFPFRSILSFWWDTKREIYCFGVLANPRFRRSERSAFGIISRCKRSCLAYSRFPLVNPLETVKIIIRLGGKRSPTKGTGDPKRTQEGGRSRRGHHGHDDRPKRETHTYRSGVGLHTYIHTYVGSCGCCGAKRWLAKRVFVLVGLALDWSIHT